MTSSSSKVARLYSGTMALISWAAIILQLYILIVNSSLDLFSTIVHFFSFFTILSNLLVALYSTFSIIHLDSSQGKFITSPFTSTAIVVYIIVVGLVYNAVLRQLWHPQGLQKIVDEALHLVVPILFTVYWFLFVSRKDLRWKDSFKILLFPFLYLIYTLAHGAVTGFYPYPFVNVTGLGYGKVIINSAGLCVLFWLLSIGFIVLGRKQKK